MYMYIIKRVKFFFLTALTSKILISCNNQPPGTVYVNIQEVNVPPDYISTVPAALVFFDDTPVGSILGTAKAHDHNTNLADSTAFLSLTPCNSPLSSSLPPGLNDTIWVLPTNCTSGVKVYPICYCVLCKDTWFLTR